MAKKILIGAGAALLLLIGIVTMQANTYHVERSLVIKAPAAVVFEEVNDFRRWAQWSPWDKLDPTMKKTFEGPATGVGAIYAWEGNGEVGAGRMTITDSVAASRVAVKLEFLQPMTSEAKSAIALSAAEGGVKVTWSMDGEHGFAGKLFSLFMDMDAMVGGMYEQGLANLQTIAERNAKAIEEAAAAKAAAEAQAQAQAAADAAAAEAGKNKKKK